VGFVHHCLYGVFDQLGPQLRWWEWNTGNALNRPMLASVPMTSVWIFAALGPVVVTLLVFLFVGRDVHRRVGSLAWRTALAGVLTPIGIAILSLPSSIFSGEVTAQAIVFSVELATVAVIAGAVLGQQWRRRTAQDGPSDFVRIFGPIYLGVLAVLWISALPDYFGAVDGVTRDGTPTGSLLYAAVSFVAAALCVAAAASARDRVEKRTDDVDGFVRRLKGPEVSGVE
jgi:hypothetical protein